MIESNELMGMLKKQPDKAIALIYDNYFYYLCNVIYKMLPDRKAAEDIVQEVFLEIWKKRKSISIRTKIKPYLKRAARNKTLNYIRDRKLVTTEIDYLGSYKSNNKSGLERLQEMELQKKIDFSINQLPNKCRIIFQLSRFEDMKYSEIATELNISVKTVESQISKALQIIRKEVLD